MVHHRSVKSTRRVRGAGYQTSQQFFNPDVLPPHTTGPFATTAPTETVIRPVLGSTFKVGGRRSRHRRSTRRSTRRSPIRGGFSPSVMGPFIRNAQNAIVPLALYTAYHFMPKKGRNIASARRSRSRRSGRR
jgi:hypothetical protein